MSKTLTFLGALLFLGAVFILFPSSPKADEEGDRKVVQDIISKVIQIVQAQGLEATLVDINSGKEPFNFADHYVTATNFDGVSLANGGFAKMAGKSLWELTDVDGKYFVQEQVALAKSKGTFWENYKFTDPVTKKMRPKTVFCQTVQNVIFCSGYYK